MSTPQYPGQDPYGPYGHGQDPYGPAQGQDPYGAQRPAADPYGGAADPYAVPGGAPDPYAPNPYGAPAPAGSVPPPSWQPAPSPEAPEPAPVTPPPGTPAPYGKRIGALVIDLGIAAVIGVVMIVLGVVFALGGSAGLALAFGVLAYVGAFAWIIVMIVLQGSSQSVGARMMRIRIARLDDGAAIGFWRALLRHLVFSAAGAIIVGYFSVLFDKTGRGQGWHDMAVGSVVLEAADTDESVTPSGHDVAAPGDPAFFGAAPGHDGRLAPPHAQPGTAGAPFGQAPADPYAGQQAPADPYAGQPAAGDPYVSPTPAAQHASGPVDPFGAGATVTPPPVPPVHPGEPAAPSAREPGPAGPSVPPAATEPPIARTGDGPVIDFVPGITQDGPAARPAADAPPVPPRPAEVPIRPVATPSDEQPTGGADMPAAGVAASLEETVVVRRGRRAPSAELVWDDGTRHALLGRALFGRNPAAEPGVGTVSVRDETLSLSKTHFEIEVADDGVWLTDRHSTNGVTIVRASERTDVTPGERTALAAGDVLEMGDRITTLEMSSPANGVS